MPPQCRRNAACIACCAGAPTGLVATRGAWRGAGRGARGGAQVGVQPYAVQVPAQLRAGAALDVLVPTSAGGPGALKVRVAVPDALGPGRTLQLNLVTARLPPGT
jgi:hypothetical protein